MSKDLPRKSTKKNGLKKLGHAKIALAENGVNFLNSEVVSQLHAHHNDTASPNSKSLDNDDPVSILNNNLHTCTRLLNGVHVSIACKSCNDVLKIHRCSSDGKLTDHDDASENVISKSLSSSDSCMNGSHSVDSTDQSVEMSGTVNRCNGIGTNNLNQGDESHDKSYPTSSKSQTGKANLILKVNSLNEDGNTVRDNDVVRPKTWSRKLAEKSKLKKEMVLKESVGNNTQTKREVKPNEDKTKTIARTCKAFEHDRNLIRQQSSGLVSGNVGAQCSVVEIVPPVHEGILTSHPGANAFVTNGDLEPVNGNLTCDQCVDESRTDSCASDDLTDMPALVVAPLAEPEDVSDDEICACCSSSTGNDSARSNSDNKTSVDQWENDVSENNTDFSPSESNFECSAFRENKPDQVTFLNGSRNDTSKSFAVYPESIFSRAPDEDDSSVSYGYSSPLSNTISGASATGGADAVTILEKQSPHRIDAMNEHAQNLQQVSSSSIDSLEEIGDYIETDLPPNRLAFFSRGSSSSTTTEEDEGCGDEVLPNNDEESDNETIDPLNSYHNPGLPNLPDVQYNNQPLSFSMNLNNDRCQNPSFGNNNWGQNFLGNSLICSRHVDSAQSCDSKKGDNSDSLIGRNHRPENRNETSSINVSDSCQLNDLRRDNNEGLQEENERTTSHLPDTNCGSPNETNFVPEMNGEPERLSNLDEIVRHSSSESEAAGMLYIVSDDSENASPEFESGVEYVFPSVSTSASFSGGPVGMYLHQKVRNIIFIRSI